MSASSSRSATPSTVAVTSRTEYLDGAQRTLPWVAWGLLAAAFVVLVGGAAYLPGLLTAGVTLALVAASLLAAAVGRTRRRRAVICSIDGDTLALGSEGHGIQTLPLGELAAVDEAPVVHRTSSMTGPEARDLRIAGYPAIRLTFISEATVSETVVSETVVSEPAGETVWFVPALAADPVMREIVARMGVSWPTRGGVTEGRPKSTGHTAGPTDAPVSDGPTDVPAAAAAGPRIADAGSDDAAQRLWEEATRDHDEVLGAYAAYEIDPEALLRFPGVTDITREPVQAFHEALDDAEALRTEKFPRTRDTRDRERAQAYQSAVRTLRRAWIACETAGRREGTSYLEARDQRNLDTALKLFRHAGASSEPAEQATYYGRVRDIVTGMVDEGRLHAPAPAVEELRAVTRRALEA